MPSWTDYTKKQQPSDNDLMMIEDVDANVNKRLEFSGLANWIVEKLKKNNVISGALKFKGSSAYASLPTNPEVNDYYYSPDGNGTDGAGYYAWNGTAWIFIGNNDKDVDSTFTVEGAAADSKAVGDKFAKVDSETASLRKDIGDLATFGKNQYIDSKTVRGNTLWRNLSGNITRADGYSGFSTFPMINLIKGTYYISKKIWHKYTWVKKSDGEIVALNTIDKSDEDTYSGAITFLEDVELYITIQSTELPLMLVDGVEEPPYYIDAGKYGKSINGNYKVNNCTLLEIEKNAIRDYTKIDYHFVKNGKLVCNNSNRTSAGAVAKYTKADMGNNIVKAMCVFSARNGGNVTLISTQLDTDNNVQNIVNKSIHCIFGMSSCVAQTFLNGTAKTLGSITYPTLNNDDTTEYECGFEIINNNTLRLYAPNGETLDCTGDWTEYNGKFFIYEEYNGKPNIADITSEWERPSIIAVFCKPTNGHCLRDEFKNYPNGYIPCVAPSGHVYTNFRNVTADDDKYVNANGTHDN